MESVFEFSSYKKYLEAVESERSTIQRGFRSRLSETLSCQNAYISQILNSNAHFSLEQGLKISTFLQHGEMEAKYFLLLIEFARAGTAELKKFFQKDLQALREKHLNIKERVSTQQSLSKDHENIYYSSWIYPTMHMLITIPSFRTIAKIASALSISEDITRDVMMFLVLTGLAIEKKTEFFPGPTKLHLSKESSNIRQHHSNWRIAAIQSLATKDESGVHYSTVSSLSLEDAELLRARFVQVIEDYVKVIVPSKEETIYNFNLDFYSLIK